LFDGTLDIGTKLIFSVIAGIGRVAAGDFRRGIDSERCGLARVKRDAGCCAEPVSKDAKRRFSFVASAALF
jgi:hypothetical protein